MKYKCDICDFETDTAIAFTQHYKKHEREAQKTVELVKEVLKEPESNEVEIKGCGHMGKVRKACIYGCGITTPYFKKG